MEISPERQVYPSGDGCNSSVARSSTYRDSRTLDDRSPERYVPPRGSVRTTSTFPLKKGDLLGLGHGDRVNDSDDEIMDNDSLPRDDSPLGSRSTVST